MNLTELIEILSQIVQGPINEAADLPLQLINISLFFGQGHPAELDRLPYLLVNLAGAKDLSHPPSTLFVVRVNGFRRNHGSSLCRLGRNFHP